MNTTRTFEHDNKKYKIKKFGNPSSPEANFRIDMVTPHEEPSGRHSNLSGPTWFEFKELEGNIIHFDKRRLQDGDLTGIKASDEAINFIKEHQREHKEMHREHQEEQESKSVFTYRTWTGKKRTRADSIEEAAEYFSEEYDVNATPENVEKVEEDSRASETEVEESQETDEEKEETDEKVCSAKGCGKRKDRKDTYCQFHQELKAEAQNTDRDATPAHPTGGTY